VVESTAPSAAVVFSEPVELLPENFLTAKNPPTPTTSKTTRPTTANITPRPFDLTGAFADGKGTCISTFGRGCRGTVTIEGAFKTASAGPAANGLGMLPGCG